MYDAIIDTDPGHDDAMAIMLAVKSGLFRVKAITTVAGNTTVKNTTRNAQFVLKLLGREDIPVYSGSEKPLERELVKAVVHGETGLAGIDPTNEPILSRDAVARILEIVKGNPDRITLITLGPLTNIAKAILKDRRTMMKLRQIVIMGGAIRAPGNKNRVAEFNMFVDPEAADVVLGLPVKKTLIPLDACNHVRLGLEDFARIGNAKIRAATLAMAKPYIANIYKEEKVKAALMYDPLTVYSLMNPKACRKKGYDVKVETRGEITRGMTVADLRKWGGKEVNVTVVERISEKEFKRDFVRCLSR